MYFERFLTVGNEKAQTMPGKTKVGRSYQIICCIEVCKIHASRREYKENDILQSFFE
jgi:hypothetical protein